VKTLAAKGLLRTNRRGGTVVLPVARWNLLDLQVVGWALAAQTHRAVALAELAQLAAMVVPEIAALAARHATTTQTLRLAEACEAMAADDARAVEAQVAFLAHLFAAARNRIAASLVPAFAALWRAAPLRRNDAAYQAVADAVQRRDGAAARQAMINLLAAGEAGASAPRVRIRAGRRDITAEASSGD
jgi:DNA-binding FadR family transcriptional regulator